MRKALILIVLTFFTASLSYAQETTGTLNGRVVDGQGLPVPGAAVTVTGPQGAKRAMTDSDGRFALPFLVPGVYDVTGFTT